MKSDKDGAPKVVFMHGWGGGVLSFLPVAERMKDCDRLLFDFKGFGDSPLENALTLEDYAADTLALMDETGVDKAVLVGHSFGCRVGAYIAAHYPERVLGFVVTDGAGLKPRRSPGYYFKIAWYKIRKRLNIDTSDAGSEDYKALSGEMKKTFVGIVNRFTDGECKKIGCPTLIVWGKNDTDTPPYMAKRFNRLIKDSAVIMLNGGHFCYIEELPRYAAIVRKFVSGVSDGMVCDR